MKKKRKTTIINRKARQNYQVVEMVEAGVVLTGAEVKSLRKGAASLKEAHVRVGGGKAQLINMHISPYEFARNEEYEPTRTRQLLLNKKEIEWLEGKVSQKGLALIPTRVYVKGKVFKVEIGVARGKKEYQKREELKRRDLKREAEREVKDYYK